MATGIAAGLCYTSMAFLLPKTDINLIHPPDTSDPCYGRWYGVGTDLVRRRGGAEPERRRSSYGVFAGKGMAIWGMK